MRWSLQNTLLLMYTATGGSIWLFPLTIKTKKDEASRMLRASTGTISICLIIVLSTHFKRVIYCVAIDTRHSSNAN